MGEYVCPECGPLPHDEDCRNFERLLAVNEAMLGDYVAQQTCSDRGAKE